MADINPLNNLSYTNKDFQTIYPELLTLVKNLSSKWDPTVSNESDPGVLLIKLCAIIADKNDYNIDKNVLECFPLSVAQESNARQLFEQLGYIMGWYKGATTDVSLRWIGDTTEGYSVDYSFGKFPMVSDSDNATVYTLIDDIVLPDDGTTVTTRAIQGIATQFLLNGSDTITSAELDSEKRIFLPDINVAENGIFISNADGSYGTEDGDDSYGGWRKVDNLAVEMLGKTIYKFGVTQDGSSCYIQFPEDAEYLIGQGIKIVYIRTDGSEGNIASRELEKFYNDTYAYVGDNEIQITSEEVQITNVSGTSNGADPETIESAYRNYKKTIGTFDTLVTLRDYTNAINESGIISNGFVTDRTNDIQSSYNVVSYNNGITKKILQVEEGADSNPEMDAFDLKIYALNRGTSSQLDAKSYNSTFEVLVNDESSVSPDIDKLLSYIQDAKCIQHDFGRILRNKVCMIKNKYIINCKIIPQYRVTDVQEKAISKNIRSALYTALNSQKIDFGEEIAYDTVYDIISKSDERIKSVVLENLSFTTHAVYYDGTAFKEVLINSLNDRVCGYFYGGNFYEDVNHTNLITPTTGAYYTDISMGTDYSNKVFLYNGYEFIEDITSEIQDTIYAKSVLNGNTQILYPDDGYDYALNQKFIPPILNDVASVTTNASITMTGNGTATYDVGEKEHIFLYAPNLTDSTQYSTYVKYQFVINNDIDADSDYMLSENESITFYWKEEDDDEADYIYYKYGKDQIIHPNFKVLASNSTTSGYVGSSLSEGKGTVPHEQIQVEGTSYDMNAYIASNFNYTPTSKCTLSGTRSVTIRRKNETTLDSASNPCYWILNTKQSNGTYRLFSASQDEYILQSGEYFVYTNVARSELFILGSGTKISRSDDSSIWAVPIIDYTDIVEEGVSALSGAWFTIPSSAEVTVTEMQFQFINEGNTFSLSANVWDEDSTYVASGTELTRAGDTPMSLKIKAVNGTHYYNSTDEKSWTPTPAAIDVVFDNSGTTVNSPLWSVGNPYSLSDFTMAYATEGSTEYTEIPSIVLSGNDGWNGRSMLNFTASSTSPQILKDNQSISWTTSTGATGTIVGSNASPIYVLTDYPYNVEGGVDIDVTRININGEIFYMSMYLYTLSESSDEDIKYENDGSISILIDATDSENTYEWVETDSDYDEISSAYKWEEDNTYDATGIDLTVSGLTPMSEGITPSATAAHYYNSADEKSWTAVLSATELDGAGETPTSESLSAIYGATAFNSVDMKAWKSCAKIDKQLEFNLPLGTYIVPLDFDSTFESIKVSVTPIESETPSTPIPLTVIYDNTVDTFTSPSTYYLSMDLSSIYASHPFDELQMNIECYLSKGSQKIQIRPIYKYGLPIIGTSEDGTDIVMTDGTFNSILHKVFALDKNNVYDYTYVVDADDEIEFPLKAESFFSKNHILNSFTICQIDTKNMSIYVTNKIK